MCERSWWWMAIGIALGACSDERADSDVATTLANDTSVVDATPDATIASEIDEGTHDGEAPDDDATIVAPDVIEDVVEPAKVRLRVVAANLTSGELQQYEGPGIRILQGLDADVALLQEVRYATEEDFGFASVDDFIAGTFGEDTDFHLGSGTLPNGIVSRYPILEAGTWDDPTVPDRGFDWARIDVPGARDLWAVSLHLKASSADEDARTTAAQALVGLVEANVPEGDLLVMGGDLNTYARNEAALGVLAAIVDTGGPWPDDGHGDQDTNGGRTSPYDWVLADADLAAGAVPVVVGERAFTNGLVADTRVYQPLADIAPARASDSGASGMQHMAVVRDFELSDAPPLCDPEPCEDPVADVVPQPLAVGGASACAIEASGAVACWGENQTGQALGPSEVVATNVAIGMHHACAIVEGGALTCWGEDNQGTLDAPSGSFITLALGQRHGCAVEANGRVRCWGANEEGQATAPGGTDFTRVVAGRVHSCALRRDGRISCWGDIAAAPSAAGHTLIATNNDSTCALTASGTITCWGAAIGAAPVVSDVRALAVGAGFGLVLDGAGDVHCWGDPNVCADLDRDGHDLASLVAGESSACGFTTAGALECWGLDVGTVTAPPPTRGVAVAAGSSNICTLDDVGRITCIGFPLFGVTAAPSGSGFTHLGMGALSACALDATQTIRCWGDAADGKTTPPSGAGWKDLAVGVAHACAIDSADHVTCWGRNDGGSTAVPAGSYRDVAAGSGLTCALRMDGTLGCWGVAFEHRLDAPSGDDFVRLWTHEATSCAERADHSIVCWGYGGASLPEPGATFVDVAERCGVRTDGTLACWGTSDAPPLVPPVGDDFIAIGAGSGFACAAARGGTVECWGQLFRPRSLTLP